MNETYFITSFSGDEPHRHFSSTDLFTIAAFLARDLQRDPGLVKRRKKVLCALNLRFDSGNPADLVRVLWALAKVGAEPELDNLKLDVDALTMDEKADLLWALASFQRTDLSIFGEVATKVNLRELPTEKFIETASVLPRDQVAEAVLSRKRDFGPKEVTELAIRRAEINRSEVGIIRRRKNFFWIFLTFFC